MNNLKSNNYYLIYFSVSDPDPLHETDPDPGSKEISQNHGKFPQKSDKITRIEECHVFFLSQYLTFV